MPTSLKNSDREITTRQPRIDNYANNSSQTHHTVDDVYLVELTRDDHLGSGSYGIVTLESLRDWPPTLNISVRRTAPPRSVAVKRFSRYKDGDYAIEAAVREMKHLKKVARHPNFVQMLGILYESPDKREVPLGYTMNYFSEGTLHAVIHGMSPRVDYDYTDILNWLRQAAEALQYLHGFGFIHCDVKPLNILLNNQHRSLLLCDLGSCQPANEMRVGGVGTVRYMAPEVIGFHGDVMYTESSDVYSLSITVWEIQHRRYPFFDDNLADVPLSEKICEDHHRPEISGDCNLKLKKMIESSWSPNRANRPRMREIEEFAVEHLRQ